MRRSSDGLIGCPGSGAKPAEWPNVKREVQFDEQGRAVCSRCGRRYKLRADGRIKAHRVPEAEVVPMIRAGLDPARGRIRGRRV